MLNLESYKNYQVNIFYYLGLLGYKLHKELIIGGCGTEKLKQDLKVLNVCMDFINCYDYPFNISSTRWSVSPGIYKMDHAIGFLSSYNTINFIGAEIVSTAFPSGTLITGVEQTGAYDLIYTNNDALVNGYADIIIRNNRKNCVEPENYTKVVNLINRILNTSYCVPVEADY